MRHGGLSQNSRSASSIGVVIGVVEGVVIGVVDRRYLMRGVPIDVEEGSIEIQCWSIYWVVERRRIRSFGSPN